MKQSLLLPGIFAVAATAACAGPRTPRAATIREQDGTLRPLWGMAANLVNGAPLPVKHVRAAAFSGSAGVVLSEGAVRLLTLEGVELGAYATSELKPVLSISGPADTAVAWLPASEMLIRWDGNRFHAIRLNIAATAGAVLDIYLRDNTQAELLVRGEDGSVTRANVSLRDGRVRDEGPIPALRGSAIQMDAALLFHDANGLEIESPGGSFATLPMREADLTYERAGDHCIHLLSASAGRQWLLHLNGTVPSLSEIAPVNQPKRSANGEAK